MQEIKVLDRATEARQLLDSENIPDGMEGEQTWPTDDELKAADIAARPEARKITKVPKGMSEYQAAWINEEAEYNEDQEEAAGEDEEDDDDMDDGMAEIPDAEEEEESEEEQDEECDTQTEAMTEAGGDDDYDAKHVNFAAEVDAMEALKTARVDSQFPDEVHWISSI